MDLPLVIDKLVPGADYRRADDYQTLVDTWVDARNIPTEEAIAAKWAEIESASINPVPVSVLSHQLFTALSRHSISEATIAAIINGMPEGQAKVEADLAFRRAPQIRRDHPIALAIATALSLSVETVDQIFREASEI
jgi:hypothetical protein